MMLASLSDLDCGSFLTEAGEDVADYWSSLAIDEAMRSRMQLCLDNLFYVGNVDARNFVKCQFADYLILATFWLHSLSFARPFPSSS